MCISLHESGTGRATWLRIERIALFLFFNMKDEAPKQTLKSHLDIRNILNRWSFEWTGLLSVLRNGNYLLDFISLLSFLLFLTIDPILLIYTPNLAKCLFVKFRISRLSVN